MALSEAGESARGATVYCTLEPCSHQGRTPPCVDALIAAGVAKVVFAIEDPDEKVSGRGKAALEVAGIEVEVGDGAEDASRLLEAYIKHRRTGLPFVIVKYAATLDGRIAATSGDSRWVSGPETLGWAHENRPKLDAIMVGSSTIVVDDPQLTARPGGALAEHQPLRVVVDSTGRIPATAKVLQGAFEDADRHDAALDGAVASQHGGRRRRGARAAGRRRRPRAAAQPARGAGAPRHRAPALRGRRRAARLPVRPAPRRQDHAA